MAASWLLRLSSEWGCTRTKRCPWWACFCCFFSCCFLTSTLSGLSNLEKTTWLCIGLGAGIVIGTSFASGPLQSLSKYRNKLKGFPSAAAGNIAGRSPPPPLLRFFLFLSLSLSLLPHTYTQRRIHASTFSTPRQFLPSTQRLKPHPFSICQDGRALRVEFESKWWFSWMCGHK